MALTPADLAAFSCRTPVLRSTVGRLIKPLVVNKQAMHRSLFFRFAGRRVPLTPVATVAARLTGKSIRQTFSDPDAMYDAACAAIFRFKLDAMMIVADFTVDAEALGCKLRFPENELPSVATHFVKSHDDLKKLSPVNPLRDGRMPVFLNVIRRLTRRFPLLMGSGSCGPFTTAAELCGVEDFCLKTITEPDFVESLMGFCTDQIIAYNRAQVEAGSDVIVLGEPSASVLSPRAFTRFALPCLQRIADALPCPVVLHICGDANHLVSAMAESRASALSFDAPVDLWAAAQKLPEHMIIAGNLDPISVMAELDAGGVRQKTRELLEKMKSVPLFIPATGCDLMPETPFENVDAFFETVKNFR
ncbi:MAG: uroporphyrinogen decarboxylase family protein [Thermodesulfobacteriota bacterium]